MRFVENYFEQKKNMANWNVTVVHHIKHTKPINGDIFESIYSYFQENIKNWISDSLKIGLIWGVGGIFGLDIYIYIYVWIDVKECNEISSKCPLDPHFKKCW